MASSEKSGSSPEAKQTNLPTSTIIIDIYGLVQSLGDVICIQPALTLKLECFSVDSTTPPKPTIHVVFTTTLYLAKFSEKPPKVTKKHQLKYYIVEKWERPFEWICTCSFLRALPWPVPSPFRKVVWELG